MIAMIVTTQGPRSKFLSGGGGGLFLAPLFLSNYFLFNLFLLLQKSRGAKAPPSGRFLQLAFDKINKILKQAGKTSKYLNSTYFLPRSYKLYDAFNVLFNFLTLILRVQSKRLLFFAFSPFWRKVTEFFFIA